MGAEIIVSVEYEIFDFADDRWRGDEFQADYLHLE